MKIVVVDSLDSKPVWTEPDWPVVPRKGETVSFGSHELEVLDVDHLFQQREVRVWVRVPRFELRGI